MGLKSYQSLVGDTHKLCATINLEDIVERTPCGWLCVYVTLFNSVWSTCLSCKHFNINNSSSYNKVYEEISSFIQIIFYLCYICEEQYLSCLWKWFLKPASKRVRLHMCHNALNVFRAEAHCLRVLWSHEQQNYGMLCTCTRPLLETEILILMFPTLNVVIMFSFN